MMYEFCRYTFYSNVKNNNLIPIGKEGPEKSQRMSQTFVSLISQALYMKVGTRHETVQGGNETTPHHNFHIRNRKLVAFTMGWIDFPRS